jgi:hypothetical protein
LPVGAFIRLNRELTWDPKQERFVGDPEANLRLLARKMPPSLASVGPSSLNL